MFGVDGTTLIFVFLEQICHALIHTLQQVNSFKDEDRTLFIWGPNGAEASPTRTTLPISQSTSKSDTKDEQPLLKDTMTIIWVLNKEHDSFDLTKR